MIRPESVRTDKKWQNIVGNQEGINPDERKGKEPKFFELLHTDLTLAPLSTQKVPSGTTSSHARRIVVPLG